MQLHRHADVVVNFISILKIIVSMTGEHFIMNSSLSSKDITVTKCLPVIRTNLFKRNISLPTVDDKYSFTRARNALALSITSIEILLHIFLCSFHFFMTQLKGGTEIEYYCRVLIPSTRSMSTDDSSILTGLLSSGSNSTLSRRDIMR